MKPILSLLLLLPLSLLAACAGDQDTAVPVVSGPALLMFYTDN